MRLVTLGGLRLAGAQFGRHKPLLALAYLALEGPQDRRFLAELMWPRAADPRQSLSVALSQLNAAAPGLVASAGSRVVAKVECDAVLLREAGADREWRTVAGLAGGPFLAGVELDKGNVELEEWVYATRELLGAQVTTALIELAEAEIVRGDMRAAARLAERAAATPEALAEPGRTRRLHALLAATASPRLGALRREALENGLELPEPAAPAPRRATHNLPTDLTRFVGREAELTTLAELLLGGARLVTITGLGGMGKTRLALELARRLAESGRYDRILFVPLGSLQTRGGVEPHVLAAAGVLAPEGAASGGRRPDELAAALGGGTTLLVLDDLREAGDEAERLTDLLAAAPRLALLVTSRVPLGLPGETQLRLGGLRLPGSASGGGEPGAADALELYVQTARRYDPGFAPEGAELAGVVAVCDLVAGAPLAIELAAALTRVLPPTELLAELRADLEVLAAAVDPEPRNATVGALFGSSWSRLSEAERAALAGCAIFEGGFSRRASSEVLEIDLATLGLLLDKSLLRRQGARFELHPLVRQYAAERLADRPEAAAWREAHAAHFCAWFDSKRPYHQRSGQRAAFEELALDFPNLRAAWHWAASAGRVDLLELAIYMVARFLTVRGRTRELAELLDEAEEVAAPGTFLHGQVLRSRAWSLTPEAPFQARLLLELALEAYRSSGMHDAVGAVYHDLGVVNAYLGEVEAARRYWLDAVPLLERSDDEQLLGATYSNLSLTTAGAAEHERWAARARTTCRQRGATAELVLCLANQSTQLAYTYGDYAGALVLLDEAARLEDLEVGREVNVARFHYIAVFHLVNMDRTDLAAERLAEARRILELHSAVRDDGAGQYPPFAWAAALLHHARGELAEARAAAATRPNDTLCRELACRIALEAGEPAAAAEHLAALKVLRGFGIATRARLHEQVVAHLFRAELARLAAAAHTGPGADADRAGLLEGATAELVAALELAVEHTFVPLALEAFVIAAALEPERFGGEQLLLAAHHPAGRYFVRRRAGRVVGGLPPPAADRGQQRAWPPATPDEVLRLAGDLAVRLRSPGAAAPTH